MRRLLAVLLIPALVTISGVVPSLHVHAAGDHTHAEHHHAGLAAHHHQPAAPGPMTVTPRLAKCEPGDHSIAFALVCAEPPAPQAPVSALPAAVVVALTPCSIAADAPIDVRVHGPPSRTRIRPRAPPPIPAC